MNLGTARGIRRGGEGALALVLTLALALALAVGLVLGPTPASAQGGTTYYVGNTGDSTTTTSCTSTTNTTCTLRGAISVATSGSDTIHFTAALNGQAIILTSNTPLTLAYERDDRRHRQRRDHRWPLHARRWGYARSTVAGPRCFW